MTLTPQKTRTPFIILTMMFVVGFFASVKIFIHQADFSFLGFIHTFWLLLVLCIPGFMVVVGFRKSQSIELTDEGIWSLIWIKPTKAKMWPRLERTLLKWTDMQRWKTRGHVIYVYGAQHRVAINTLLFKDGNEVVAFINKATNAK